MFEMKPEYYIGIDMIDQEHKQLFDYASEAYELLQEEFTPDKYDKIDAILEKLRDYTVKHFSDEEAYMESIQYKKIFTQKIQHQEFITKLDEFIDQHEKDEEDQRLPRRQVQRPGAPGVGGHGPRRVWRHRRRALHRHPGHRPGRDGVRQRGQHGGGRGAGPGPRVGA